MKKIIAILGVVVLSVLILSLVLPIPVIKPMLSRAISSPCDYYAGGWSYNHGTCECKGIKIETTSCLGCSDAPSSKGCIGKVENKKCFVYNATKGSIMEKKADALGEEVQRGNKTAIKEIQAINNARDIFDEVPCRS
jgi:hypothetical protein